METLPLWPDTSRDMREWLGHRFRKESGVNDGKLPVAPFGMAADERGRLLRRPDFADMRAVPERQSALRERVPCTRPRSGRTVIVARSISPVDCIDIDPLPATISRFSRHIREQLFLLACQQADTIRLQPAADRVEEASVEGLSHCHVLFRPEVAVFPESWRAGCRSAAAPAFL